MGRRLADGDVPLAALTDHELGAVTGPGAADGRLVPLPRVGRLPSVERTAALAHGRQSLQDRGLLDDAGTPGGELAVILPIRARPRVVTMADRTARGVPTQRYLYGTVLPGVGEAVLEEDVDAAGAHRFTLRSQTSARSHLAGFVDPEERAGPDDPARTGHEMTVPGSWSEVDAAMASVEVVTRLLATRNRGGAVPAATPEQPRSRRASVVAGPRGVFLIAGYPPATEEQAADGAVLFARSLSRESLGTVLDAFIHPDASPTGDPVLPVS